MTKIEFVAMLAIAAVVAVVVLGLAWELLRPSQIPPRLRFAPPIDHPNCRGVLMEVREVEHEAAPGCEAFCWPARTTARTDKAPAEHVREAVAAFLAGGPDYRGWS